MNEALSQILKSSYLITPEICLILSCLILLIIASFNEKPKKYYLGYTLLSILFYLIVLHFFSWDKSAFFDMIILDKKAFYFKIIIILSSLLFLLHSYLNKEYYRAEFYVLFLFLVFALVFLTMVNHFLILFLLIELSSLCLYVLVGFQKEKNSFQSSINYLIFGATSSAIMLYGLSLLYGVNHTLYFFELASIKEINSPAIQILFFMIIGGLLFKLSAAPFHLWVNEVFTYIPLSFLSFLSVAPKIASVIVLLRVITPLSMGINELLGIVIIGTLLIGNTMALSENEGRKMLAYSGIAQAGFLMMPLLLPDIESLFMYSTVYVILNMGAFLFLELIQNSIGSTLISEMKGWGKQFPILMASAFIIFLGLVGLPPTIGFLAKYAVFNSVYSVYENTSNSFYIILLVIGILNAAVSIYYYLKIPYFGQVLEAKRNFPSPSKGMQLALIAYAIIIILFFIFPLSYPTL